jgi:hypothetical protein
VNENKNNKSFLMSANSLLRKITRLTGRQIG